MHLALRISICACLIFFSGVVGAAENRYLESPQVIRKELDMLMELLAKSKGPDFFQKIRPLSVVPVEQFDDVELRWVTGEKSFVRAYGLPTASEFIRTEKAGSRMVRWSYFLHFEKYVMVWRFTFYKVEKGWTMTAMGFEQNAESLLTQE